MKNLSSLFLSAALLAILLAACGSTAKPPPVQETVTVNPSFQSAITPIPTVPTYRCGAWSSVNNPGTYSTITIYAKLTKNITGVGGATATAVVHFQGFDMTLDNHPTSDNGGYVTFSLPLQGRQPAGVPATVDVIFQMQGTQVKCTPAFFTPG
jgi:hypothetical protein